MSATPDPRRQFDRPSPTRRKRTRTATELSAETFHEQFNETLAQVLDLAGWVAGDPGTEYRRIEEEVQRAVEAETDWQRNIRQEIFPMIATSDTRPPGAGLYSVGAREILDVQRGLLFNGAVEACDGTNQEHDSLALTIHQLAVSLVSYRGDQNSWQMRLFRRDVKLRHGDPVDAVMDMLEKRAGRRDGLHASAQDPLSELARRGLMTYAERAVLARQAKAPWRLGHGSPAPLELIGARFTDLTIESIKVIRELIHHGRFVFVASEPVDRALLAIGQGLRPLEYIVIGTLPERLTPEIEDWAPTHPATVSTQWDGSPLPASQWVQRFLDEEAPQVVYGLYRATILAPPQLFYAHVDHAAIAARIALADSVLVEQRGFPLLIDLADRVCRSVYGGGSLREMAQSAYATAQAPFRYQSEARHARRLKGATIMTPVSEDATRLLAEELEKVAEEYPPNDAEADGAIGRTMFDTPGSEDLSITVLLSQERAQKARSQALVRVVSQPDGRRYLGIVDAGPFAEPDSLRANSPILLAVATRDASYLPRYHGRVQVKLLGEELADGALVPPRLRPLPHSPVYLLDEAETARVLKAEGDLRLGVASGHAEVVVRVPSQSKAVLPRHTAILGTTGGGKSTTVAGLIHEAVAAGMAVVLLDVEGEYTFLHEPTEDLRMRQMLASLGRKPAGLPAEAMTLYHLVDRETTNPRHPGLAPFSLQFARLSPYTVMAMTDCNEAQGDRYLFAYEVTKSLLREQGIFPMRNVSKEMEAKQARVLRNLDEFERGYPRMKLSHLLDVVGACKAKVSKCAAGQMYNAEFATPEAQTALERLLKSKDMPGNVQSWGKVNSLLWRLHRLRVFDRTDHGSRMLNYADMLQPGRLSVIDLSEAGLSELSNIAVADVLRGIQDEQDRLYRSFEKGERKAPPRVLIILEEAHEFLSAERIARTPHLFDQVARLARRGRKRWLGLTFVTQLPQHLPRQVLALCNNFILHKLTDPQVISTLKHTVAGVDDSLWARLPGLAPGQAIVSFGHMTRPILTSIDPTPGKLRMVD